MDVLLGRLCEQVGDFQFGLAENNPRLLLSCRLCLARHGILQRRGNHHVAHLNRLHRHSPSIRSLINQFLKLSLDLLAAA